MVCWVFFLGRFSACVCSASEMHNGDLRVGHHVVPGAAAVGGAAAAARLRVGGARRLPGRHLCAGVGAGAWRRRPAVAPQNLVVLLLHQAAPRASQEGLQQAQGRVMHAANTVTQWPFGGKVLARLNGITAECATVLWHYGQIRWLFVCVQGVFSVLESLFIV